MQVCISLQTDNHASTSPLSFLQAGCPSCYPTNSIKALKATATQCIIIIISRSFNAEETPVGDVLDSGMYLLRIVLIDGQNTPTQTSNTRKLIYTTGWFCNTHWCSETAPPEIPLTTTTTTSLTDLQCFDTVSWASGRDATESRNSVISCLIKARLVLPFWYQLTQVVLEKRPLERCSRSSSCGL